MNNIIDKIKTLKKQKNAIILAHYYQNGDIQDIADYVGDSYYLSEIGMKSKSDIIVFCGVKFMAEGAKILSPEKTILLPNENALCSMASMASAEEVQKLKDKHPKAKVVCYVNSSSDVKAVSDVCCTSSSAINIVKNIDSDEIIFVPDKNLGSYIQEKIPEKNIILWDGCCNIHDKIEKEDIFKAKEQYGNDIEVLVHPECTKEVRNEASFIGSTGEIIKYASKCNSKKFLIVTDEGVIHQLKKNNKDKIFYSLNMRCKNMKITTLEQVYSSLLNLQGNITLNEEIRKRAYNALINMHKLGK